jgi:hypothetical protein
VAHASHAPPPKRFGAQEAAKRLQEELLQVVWIRRQPDGTAFHRNALQFVIVLVLALDR